ncbi:MAG: hypothetical protein IPO08_20530 [Xanthomonadales bacterium]|nr:hypothetical protein [Xanthomonadales bacterium]
MSAFKGPIVEGAYYLREDGSVGVAKAYGDVFRVCNDTYLRDGRRKYRSEQALTRRVYITHTDPAEVVRYLLDEVGLPYSAADLVAEKLGVKP